MARKKKKRESEGESSYNPLMGSEAAPGGKKKGPRKDARKDERKDKD